MVGCWYVNSQLSLFKISDLEFNFSGLNVNYGANKNNEDTSNDFARLFCNYYLWKAGS